MISEKTNARVIGILFIIATAVAALSQVMLGSSLDDATYLSGLSADSTQVRIAALLDLATATAVAAIAVMLYPILKRHSETISVAYLSARLLEAAVIVVGAVGLLGLLKVSQDFVDTAPADPGPFETLGSVLLGTRDLTDAIGTQLIFSVTALVLNYSFFRSRTVPRFISVWGLIGAPLMFASALPAVFGGDAVGTTSILLAAPLAINEMVLAGWLIVKGFNDTDLAPDTTPELSKTPLTRTS